MSKPFVDLSDLKSPYPVFDELSDEEKENIDRLAENETAPRLPVDTAFVVIIKDGGRIEINDDLGIASLISRKREPGPQDFALAAHTITEDLAAQKTASVVISMMNAVAEQQYHAAMAAQQSQQILHNLGDLKR